MTNETLADRLRRTTEQMANFANVDMRLWNEHSNACLQAASALYWGIASQLTVEEAWTILCETPDITSPEEYPDHALITMEQLGSFMARASPSDAERHEREVPDLSFLHTMSIRELEDVVYSLTAEQLDTLRHFLYPAAPPATRLAIELVGVSDQLSDSSGSWRSCSGCHELNEGHPTGEWSYTLKCHLGLGCRECGGIGAVWDNTDYSDLASPSPPAAVQEPVAVKALSADQWMNLSDDQAREMRERQEDFLWKDNAIAATSTLEMVRAIIGEMFGTIASIDSADAVLRRGPEPKHTGEAILEALNRIHDAIIAARSSAVYEVKPQEWHAHTPLSVGNFYNVLDMDGERVYTIFERAHDRVVTLKRRGIECGEYSSLEEAQAAAQADHEARIRSALVKFESCGAMDAIIEPHGRSLSSLPAPEIAALRAENERLRRVAEREFIMGRGLWEEFKEAACD